MYHLLLESIRGASDYLERREMIDESLAPRLRPAPEVLPKKLQAIKPPSWWDGDD